MWVEPAACLVVRSVSCDLVPSRSLFLRLGSTAVLAAVITLAQAPAEAQEASGLTVVTATSYIARPDDGRVDVRFAYRFENVAEGVEFPGFFESLPVSATGVRAEGDRGDLVVIPVAEADGFTTWFVAFDEVLSVGEVAGATLDWVIESGSDGVTIEAGVLAFDVYTPGSEGAIVQSALVEVPAGFEPTSALTPLAGGATADDDAAFVIETGGSYQPVSVGFVSRERFIETIVEIPPTLTIADWTGTGDWAANIAGRAETMAPTLDSWFGPRDEPFEIRRGLPSDDHPVLALDGEVPYVAIDNTTAVSVDHQLAHVWLADVPVDEDWFVEGLAAAFAGDRPRPTAAAEILGPLVDEIGATGVRAVIDALRAGTITYPGVEREAQPRPPDWRTLLDLFEGVGGSFDASSLFRSGVVDGDGAAWIDRRAAARIDYFALESRAGVWTLPPLLRVPMAEWDFDTFLARQAEVSDTIVQRDGLEAWADDLGLSSRTDAQDLFERATVDMTAVDDLLEERRDALEAFAEAERLVTDDRGLLAAVGLARSDPDSDLELLRERWAAGDYRSVARGASELTDLVEGAVGRGTLRLLAPTVVLIGLWQSVAWAIRRRRRRQVAVA
jgi:hypothetical protein